LPGTLAQVLKIPKRPKRKIIDLRVGMQYIRPGTMFFDLVRTRKRRGMIVDATPPPDKVY